MRTLVAAAAMQPEWVRQTPRQFAEVIEALLNVPIASEVDVAAIAAQLDVDAAGDAGETAQRFARFARFATLCQWQVASLDAESAEAGALAEVYHWVAGFEAASIVRRSADLYLVSDDGFYSAGPSTIQCISYRKSLKSFTEFGRHDCWHAALIEIVSAYYRMVDRNLAQVHWRRTHRTTELVRVGPYSVASGERVRTLDRPAIILEGALLHSFATNARALLVIDATAERLREICELPRVDKIQGYLR